MDHPSKKARTTSTQETREDTPKPPPITPLKFSFSLIEKAARSLQGPELAPTLETLGKRHLRLLVEAFKTNHQITRLMSNGDLIPSSARVKFNLTTDKTTDKREDYITLNR